MASESEVRSNMTALVQSDTAWGDFDADRDLDCLTTGLDPSGSAVTVWYRNVSAEVLGVANQRPPRPQNLSAEYDSGAGGCVFRWDWGREAARRRPPGAWATSFGSAPRAAPQTSSAGRILRGRLSKGRFRSGSSLSRRVRTARVFGPSTPAGRAASRRRSWRPSRRSPAEPGERALELGRRLVATGMSLWPVSRAPGRMERFAPGPSWSATPGGPWSGRRPGRCRARRPPA